MVQARDRHHSTECNHPCRYAEHGPMHLLLNAARRLLAPLSMGLVAIAIFGRARDAWRRRRAGAAGARRARTETLPSLYDVHPGARTAPRRGVGLRSVPVDRIVGTTRRPSQNTADFLPLPKLRGQNWRARWQRITGALDRLATLPPVDLEQVGDEYYVADGHNRVAAARLVDAAEIDADVTQLLVPGVERSGSAMLDASSLIGNEMVRQAGRGRHSRTVEQRNPSDEVARRDLLRDE